MNDNSALERTTGCHYRCEACGMHVVELARPEPPSHGFCTFCWHLERQFRHEPALLLKLHLLAHGNDLAELRRLGPEDLPGNVAHGPWG